MAKKTVQVVRRAPVVPAAKFQALAKARTAAAARVRQASQERMGLVVALGTSVAVGYADGRGWLRKVPTAMGVPAVGVVGAGLLVAGAFTSGSVARHLTEAGGGLACVAASQMGRESGLKKSMGAPVSGDEEYEDI